MRQNQKGSFVDEKQLAAAKQLANQKIKVSFDRIIGSPRWIVNPEGFLNSLDKNSNPNIGKTVIVSDVVFAVKLFIDSNNDLFGHGSDVLNDAIIEHDYTTAHNGVRTIIWQQTFLGMPVFNARFIAHVNKDLRLVGVSSLFISNPALGNNNMLVVSPTISPIEALIYAGNNLGITISNPVVKQNNNNKYVLSARGIRDDATCQLLWFPYNKQKMILAYEFLITSGNNGEMYRIIVDGKTGETLYRQSLTRYFVEASYRVFTNESPTPMSPGHRTPNSSQPPTVQRSLVSIFALNTNASPVGWIYTNLNQTSGNNADAYLDRNADNQPDLPRVTGNPQFVFDFALDLTQSPLSYSSASVVNLFYWVNVAHDRFYELGFTEETGNFQNDNFGKSGFQNDALKAEAQDGDGYNNSNMTTPPDGSPPKMQMFLFTGCSPYRDGSLDAEVIIHEYAHGVSDRLVGGGPGLGTLQAMGMGEGWSDFYALAMTSEPSDDPGGNYPMAAYISYLFNGITENYYYGIRRYPYSTNMSVNPLTFKDIDPSQASDHAGIPRNYRISGTADEVHNIGEVWCAVLWDMRAALINKHGFTNGNFLAMRLVIDGMKYSPINPDFLEARDAILLADRLSTGGANRNEIWSAFARRGMGFFATSPDSDTTLGLVEDFNMPDDLSATPTSGFTASGPVGGLFTPHSFYLTLTNTGNVVLPWKAACDGLIELSSYSGVLQPSGVSTQLEIKFNSSVCLLPAGIYTSILYITNLNNGVAQNRIIKLLVGQRDYFVEMFDSYDNDLDFMSLTFTPNNSLSRYSVCRTVTTNYYTDPAGGYVVTLDDDSRVQAILPSGMEVEIYGVRTNAIWIGANGEVSFAKGDTRYFYPQLSAFYEYPRVAPLYVDLNPATGGTVSWKPLSDRVAITWENVPEYGRANRNSFQVELFTNGVIRITWLNIETLGGMSGLSAGGGIPQGLTESDFTAYPQCGSFLTVSLPDFATEGDGILKNAGCVTIPRASDSNVIISLQSTDTNKLLVPETITLQAGKTNVNFDITIVDNALLDGTQYPAVIAVANGFTTGSRTMSVHDNETASVVLTLPERIMESSKTIRGDVFITPAPQRTVAIELSTSEPSTIKLPVPPVLFIGVGQTNASFVIAIEDDDIINGDRVAMVQAYVKNWVSARREMVIVDDESKALALVVPEHVAEGDGLISGGGVIYLGGMVNSNVAIYLTSSDTNKVSVPSSVIVNSNQMETAFDIFIHDNFTLDGNQTVRISAFADGFTPFTADIVVVDNEYPIMPYNPSPTNGAFAQPLDIILKWQGGFGNQIENPGFESGSLSGWRTEDEGVGGWLVSDGGLNTGIAGEMENYSGAYTAWCVQYGFGKHRMWQEIFIPETVVSATLSWYARIINRSGTYNTNNYFRVEILNQSNQVLRTVYRTEENTPLNTEWTHYMADLSQFKGKTIRVSFVEQDSNGNLFVGIDDVSLNIVSAIMPSFDVYLSTNLSPDSFVLIGTTTNSYFELKNLAPDTIYYWRVVANFQSAEISSPIWQFWTRSSNQPPSVKITAPHYSTIFTAPATIEISVSASDLDGSVSLIRLFANGKEIGQITSPPYRFVWGNIFPGLYEITAVAMDNNGLQTSSEPVRILIGTGNQTIIPFIIKSSQWRYMDDGSNQGSAWRGYYFDDSNWKLGEAPLGYGMGDEKTTLNYGSDYNNKYITYYFRNQFTNKETLSAIYLKLRRDDGALIYLNGYEILRDNLPSGSVSYTTTASSPVTGQGQFEYTSYMISNALMVVGKNVVAAEIHQSSQDSPDLIFDMELLGIGNYSPKISIVSVTNNQIVPSNVPLAISVWASDSYGKISKVEFYTNSVKAGEVSVEPFNFTIPNPPTGFMTVYARAIDNFGAASTSETVIVYAQPFSIANYGVHNTNLMLQWKSEFENVSVETTTNLYQPRWFSITNQVFISNGMKFILIPRTEPRQFFRLRIDR
ncbi:MAG: M36 family metallopeptidase [Verrucomicrobiae bacterium]|nr:M36 family metallopeptidase [Verrucomicrobiae bacterium]